MNTTRDLIERRTIVRKHFDRAFAEKQIRDQMLDRLAKELDDLTIEIAVAEMMEQFEPQMLDADAIGTGDEMTTSKLLAKELDRQMPQTRRAFFNLNDAEKRLVEERFLRHFYACQKSDIGPDPKFISELVHDIRHGFEEVEESELAIGAAAGVI